MCPDALPRGRNQLLSLPANLTSELNVFPDSQQRRRQDSLTVRLCRTHAASLGHRVKVAPPPNRGTESVHISRSSAACCREDSAMMPKPQRNEGGMLLSLQHHPVREARPRFSHFLSNPPRIPSELNRSALQPGSHTQQSVQTWEVCPSWDEKWSLVAVP